MIDTKYSVHQKIAALDNAVTEQSRDNKALRAEFAGLKQLVQSLIDMNRQAESYIAYLRTKIAARAADRIAAGNVQK
jgi:hypothetical protein